MVKTWGWEQLKILRSKVYRWNARKLYLSYIPNSSPSVISSKQDPTSGGSPSSVASTISSSEPRKFTEKSWISIMVENSVSRSFLRWCVEVLSGEVGLCWSTTSYSLSRKTYKLRWFGTTIRWSPLGLPKIDFNHVHTSFNPKRSVIFLWFTRPSILGF